MMRIHKSSVAIALAGCLIATGLGTAPSAYASESAGLSQTIHAAGPEPTSSADWSALDAAIDRSAGRFDGTIARAAGVDDDVVDEFATGWVASGGTALDADVDDNVVQALSSAANSIQACAGKNSTDHTGPQYNYYLNSCNTAKVLGMIAVGAGVAAIAAAITSMTGAGAAVAGIVAGALTVAGGVVAVCSSNGRGIVAHILQFTNVVWCNNQ